MWKLSIALFAGALVTAEASAQSLGGSYGGDTHLVGQISGSIASIDYGRGRIVVRGAEAGRTLTLNASPGELVGLNPGDVITATYADYNGNLWVTDGYGGSSLGYGAGEYADEGVIVGRVSDLDKARGSITVGGRTMRAHPDELEDLLPGQFVEADYVAVDGRRWATDLSTSYTGNVGGSGIQTGIRGGGGNLTPRESSGERSRGSLTPQYD